ncbi:hypothetical protein DPEC_G00317750 [Dallia pectoralis]|uniref:Uncharacterized protein n=1 Tax=Dallia pectoralis TaxID=75939 RepID=A0ACC2FCY4_DALPE|nr:hypothetical protein DPEC_G00317750 [Dallia pectoralis]
MQNKEKKDKESSKSGKSTKSGRKKCHSTFDQEDVNKKRTQPPSSQLVKLKHGSNLGVKKERRISASVFPISINRELHSLPAIKALGGRSQDSGTALDLLRVASKTNPHVQYTLKDEVLEV